ncbi:ribonuclease domain-containing protein [Lysobacter sp. CA199]|uniref:ribonuclease domain-containing protein n=1 Tax=Lysobacter sp. CA199 TaxID=3455608 RepID=UPI003F8CFE04
MNAIRNFAAVLCLGLLAAPALAKPPVCKSLPPDIKEAMRSMSFCMTSTQPVAECGRLGLDVQVFNNGEGKLPNAGRGQEYWEGKIRHDGAAGTRRLVYLMTMGARKNIVETRYYTPDHYATFCQIN